MLLLPGAGGRDDAGGSLLRGWWVPRGRGPGAVNAPDCAFPIGQAAAEFLCPGISRGDLPRGSCRGAGGRGSVLGTPPPVRLRYPPRAAPGCAPWAGYGAPAVRAPPAHRCTGARHCSIDPAHRLARCFSRRQGRAASRAAPHPRGALSRAQAARIWSNGITGHRRRAGGSRDRFA